MDRHSAPKEIVMPALEMAQEKGLLLRWLKTEGQLVHKGEPLMEIETDKALTEIESPDSGILSQVTAHPGDEVPVGRVIAVLLPYAAGNTHSEIPVAAERADSKHSHQTENKSEEGLQLAPNEVPISEARASAQRVLASPKARRLAAEANIDLSLVEGSGPGRAVLPEDILRVSAQKRAQSLPEYTAVSVKGMRRIIAERLQRSSQDAAHIALSLSIDMSQAKRRLHDWNALKQRPDLTLSMTALICRAGIASLLQHPRLNSHFLGDEIREYRAVQLGIAVAIADGLVVPVIRNAQTKDLAGLQSELADLSSRARAGKLRPDEMRGSTFTVSNLGMFGVEQFTAIVNPPEVGILSIGTIRDTPVVLEGQVSVRPLMQVTINADHRAVDGVVAAQFLNSLKKQLEDPASFFPEQDLLVR